MKLELAWQGFSDFDSISRSADAKGKREGMAASESHAGFEEDEKRIVMFIKVNVSTSTVVGGCRGNPGVIGRSQLDSGLRKST